MAVPSISASGITTEVEKGLGFQSRLPMTTPIADGVVSIVDDNENVLGTKCVGRILVCRGVDCAGLGSAVTLTELEELCSEVRESSEDGECLLRVSTSVCTQQCQWAPNVNVSIRGSEWEAQKQVNTPALCAKVVNGVMASIRPGSTPAIPRDGIMQNRAAGMRFNALKQISRAKTQSSKKEGAKLLAEALTAEQGAARGEAALLARSHRRAARLLLLQERKMLSPGDIACYRKAKSEEESLEQSNGGKYDIVAVAEVSIRVCATGDVVLGIVCVT